MRCGSPPLPLMPDDLDGQRARIRSDILAAMGIAEGSSAPSVAPPLEELVTSTRRAARLYGRKRLFES